jgi:hypothetical protein
VSDFDEQRLEWQFQALQREHRDCCTGALLFVADGEENAPQWINVCAPVATADGTPAPNYRPWDDEA